MNSNEIKAIIAEDKSQIRSMLNSIKRSLINLETQISQQKSPDLMSTLGKDFLEESASNFLKEAFDIRKQSTKKIFQQRKRLQNKELEKLELELFNSIFYKFESLTSSISEITNKLTLNSDRLNKKLNKIRRAKKVETKIKRLKVELQVFQNLELVFNRNIPKLRKMKQKRKNMKISSKEEQSELLKITPHNFERILNSSESVNLDFKREPYNEQRRWSGKAKSEFAKDISAFANTKGGNIVFGIEDKTNELIGINGTLFVSEVMYNLLDDYTNPPITHIEIYKIRFRGLTVGVIRIEESNNKPHEFKSVAGQWITYIRVGNRNRKARAREIINM